MCATFRLSEAEAEEIRKIIREISEKFPSHSVTGDFFPKQSIPVVKTDAGSLDYDLMKWGFPKYDSKDVIFNARRETALEKRFFADSLLKRRCLIPATGFYEWSHNGIRQKYAFTLPDEDYFYIGGFYKTFEGESRCTILTTDANDSMKDIHSRMPIILHPGIAQDWLNNTQFAIDYCSHIMPALSHIVL